MKQYPMRNNLRSVIRSFVISPLVMICLLFSMPVAVLAISQSPSPSEKATNEKLTPTADIETAGKADDKAALKNKDAAPTRQPISPEQIPYADKFSWLSALKKELPHHLCMESQFAMQCFDASAAECKQFMDIYMTACIDNINMKIPAKISLPESRRFADQITYCTQDLYQKFMGDKRRQSAHCQSYAHFKSMTNPQLINVPQPARQTTEAAETTGEKQPDATSQTSSDKP